MQKLASCSGSSRGRHERVTSAARAVPHPHPAKQNRIASADCRTKNRENQLTRLPQVDRRWKTHTPSRWRKSWRSSGPIQRLVSATSRFSKHKRSTDRTVSCCRSAVRSLVALLTVNLLISHHSSVNQSVISISYS